MSFEMFFQIKCLVINIESARNRVICYRKYYQIGERKKAQQLGQLERA